MQRGVNAEGFVIGQRLQHLASGFNTVNERLARIDIKAKLHHISLIYEHAPMEETDNALQHAFYANPKDLYDNF